MAKFKVGDRVKVVGTKFDFKEIYLGTVHTITNIEDYLPGGIRYVLGEPDAKWVFYEEDLELIPKFNIKDYPGKYAMHVKNEEKSRVLLNYLHYAGLRWHSGASLLQEENYYKCGSETCYEFDTTVSFGSVNQMKKLGYTILEFEDFDWSDFDMKKEFTKKDLKNGDVVKISDDMIGIVCLETNTIIYKDGFDSVSDLTDDLTFRASSCNAQIMAVRRPIVARDCQFTAFDREYGNLIYERKEVEEMTLEEVCKALGKEIKIVKK